MKEKTIIGAVIALVILGAIAFFCFFVGKGIYNYFNKPDVVNEQPIPQNPPNAPAPPVSSIEEARKVYLALGNPSNAEINTRDQNNFLMVNEAFALSYNNSKGTPNWVAWRITKADFGNADRQNDFRPDGRLPKGWNIVRPSDYTGSGFDRGHICPSADRSFSDEMNSETFLMTNMIPQTGDLNRNVWRDFEEFSRKLVQRGNVDLYVISGVYGDGKKLKGKVTVPTNVWKVAVAVPGGAGISAINDKTHVYAVDMPNIKGIGKDDWRKYKTTVRSIEQKTGYNLLSNLPTNLQNIIETRVE